MDSKKSRNQKEPTIELSLDREEVELEINISTPRPTYVDMKCCIKIVIVFKWGDLYQMFCEETYLEIPLP